MEDILYSEKKIAIFNGIIALMEKGINPYSIKVSDIAKAADVGKGTIYDYFTTKEEAISQAILYNINYQLDMVYSRIKKKDGFKKKFYEILHRIALYAENNISTIKTLLSFGGIQEFYEYLSDYKGDLCQHVVRINKIFQHLWETGINEGVIGMGEDLKECPYYRNMAIGSAIIGFSQYLYQRELYSDISIEDAMAAAYKLLIKALN